MDISLPIAEELIKAAEGDNQYSDMVHRYVINFAERKYKKKNMTNMNQKKI